MNALLLFTFRIPAPDLTLNADIASAGYHRTARSLHSCSADIGWLEND